MREDVSSFEIQGQVLRAMNDDVNVEFIETELQRDKHIRNLHPTETRWK